VDPSGLPAAAQLPRHLGALRGAQAAQVQMEMLAAVLDSWRLLAAGDVMGPLAGPFGPGRRTTAVM
jgi:hypothetical protein